MEDRIEELEGRCDALGLMVVVLVMELAFARRQFTKQTSDEARASIMAHVEGMLPNLLAVAETSGKPLRSAGLEKQMEFIGNMVRHAVVPGSSG